MRAGRTTVRLAGAAILAFVLGAFVAARPAAAQSSASLEYPVKANYLVKFAAFV